MKIVTRFVATLLLLSIMLGACSGLGGKDPFDTAGLGMNGAGDAGQTAETTPSVITSSPGEPVDIAPIPDSLVSRVVIERPGHLRINSVGRLADVFNDSNKYQYAAAERIGVTPISGITDAYFLRRPIMLVESNEYYVLDSLTHSMPYLVPEAYSLLNTIGRNFRDTLRSRGADGYRFRVTSLLRSAYSVKKLRRINRNATDSSTHQFGTTFDISYARFDRNGATREVSDEDLKNLLAEVLFDLRRSGKCLVKFERKSPCYHITATGK